MQQTATANRQAISAALGGLIAMAAAIGIGRFVYTPILPPMMEALGLSRSEAGLIASANFLGYLLGALAAAMPRLPGARRGWLFGSLAISALTTAAMGLTESLPAFLVLRLAGGAASAFVLIIASTLVLEYLAEVGRGGLSALHFAGVGAGIAVSATLVAAMLGSGESWKALWLASGLVSLAAMIAATTLLPAHEPPLPPGGGQAVSATNPLLRRLIAGYGLFGFGYIITATFLVAIVQTTPAIASLEPVIWIVFGLSAAPSVALWTAIAARWGISRAFALACVIEAAGVLASVAWRSPVGVVAAAVLVGGTFMGLTALGLIRARELTEGDPRRVLAQMTGAFGLGQIVGPVFAGFLSDWLGSYSAPSMVAVAALLISALLAVG